MLTLLFQVTLPAWGAEIGLQIQLLPTPPILANGISVTYVPVLVTDEAGDVLLGEAALEGTADIGEVLDTWAAAPGIYLISYRPPAMLRPGIATLGINASQGQRAGRGSIPVELVPAGRGSIEIRMEPRPFILGDHTEGELTFIARDVAGRPVPSTALSVRATEGSVVSLLPQGDGVFTATFQPPEGRHPRVILLTAVDAGAPSEVYGFHALALTGSTRFPVRAEPGVRLEFDVGDRTFGPFVTDAGGATQVRLEVPVGVKVAQVRSTDTEGVLQVEELDLAPRPFKSLTTIAPPTPISADGVSRVPVRVMVVDGEGAPRQEAPLQIHAERGEVTDLVEEGGGLYQAFYVPPALDRPESDTLIAQLTGEGDLQVDRLPLKLVPPGSAAASGGAEPFVPLSRGAVDWLSLKLDQERAPQDQPSEIPIRVHGFSGAGLAVPLRPEILLVASKGTITQRRGEPDGSITAVLSLPPLPEGATVAVVAADPIQGRSTYALVYSGESPTRSLTSGAVTGALGATAEAPDSPPTSAEPPASATPSTLPPPDDGVEGGIAEGGAPSSEDVRPPPPSGLHTRGTQLYAFYAAGVYGFSQAAAGESGTLPDDLSIETPTWLGGGLGVDHWGTSSLGLAARYTASRFAFDARSGELQQTGEVAAVRNAATVDLRLRYLARLGASGMGLGIRVGAGVQNHPLFETTDQLPSFGNDHLLWLARAGADLDLLAGGLIEAHLGYDAGMAVPQITLASHHLDASVGVRLAEHWSIGLGSELWRETIPIDDANTGDALGTVWDQWVNGRLFLGLHL